MMVPRICMRGVGRIRTPSLYQLTAMPGRLLMSQRSLRTLPGSNRRCSVVSSLRSSRTSVETLAQKVSARCSEVVSFAAFSSCSSNFYLVPSVSQQVISSSIFPLNQEAIPSTMTFSSSTPLSPVLPTNTCTHNEITMETRRPNPPPLLHTHTHTHTHKPPPTHTHCKHPPFTCSLQKEGRAIEANEHVAAWQWTESKSEGRWRFTGDLSERRKERSSFQAGDVWERTDGHHAILESKSSMCGSILIASKGLWLKHFVDVQWSHILSCIIKKLLYLGGFQQRPAPKFVKWWYLRKGKIVVVTGLKVTKKHKNKMDCCDYKCVLPGRTSSQADCMACTVCPAWVFSAMQMYSPASSSVMLDRCSMFSLDALLCRVFVEERNKF